MTYADHYHYVSGDHTHSINTNGWYQVPMSYNPAIASQQFVTVDAIKEPKMTVEQQVAEDRRKRKIEAQFDAFEEGMPDDGPGHFYAWQHKERFDIAVRNEDGWSTTTGRKFDTILGLIGYLIEQGVQPDEMRGPP